MYYSSFVFCRERCPEAFAPAPVGEWDRLCSFRGDVHGHVCVIVSSADVR
jgi:hypothetical protein